MSAMRRREPTAPHKNETLDEVREQWQAGIQPDFHVQEGDRVRVIAGEHTGRTGRVVLKHDSHHHRIVAKLLALTPDQVRVVLDRTEEGAWSGVLPLSSLIK
jgi:ribosomal protein S4E